MTLEMPEILRFLRHVQVVFITVTFPLVYGNGTCTDITNFNSIVIHSLLNRILTFILYTLAYFSRCKLEFFSFVNCHSSVNKFNSIQLIKQISIGKESR